MVEINKSEKKIVIKLRYNKKDYNSSTCSI